MCAPSTDVKLTTGGRERDRERERKRRGKRKREREREKERQRENALISLLIQQVGHQNAHCVFL